MAQADEHSLNVNTEQKRSEFHIVNCHSRILKSEGIQNGEKKLERKKKIILMERTTTEQK